MKAGSRTVSGNLTFSWVHNSGGSARFAFVVPRYGHSAVERNRLRRRLREVVRRNFPDGFPAVDVVIRTRPRAYAARFKTLKQEFLEWFRSLG